MGDQVRTTLRTTSQATRRRSALTLAGGGLIVAIGAAGCGWPLESVTPMSPGTSPTPVSAPTSTASVAPSESPPSGGSWGPLAVVPPQDGADTARREGTLRITDTCVFLVTRGGPVLLVWPADRTKWNAETRTIAFANFDGSTVSVSDGTPVVLGGGGDSNDESGTTTEAWLARTRWVARPAASCPLDSRWWVGVLTR